MQINKCEYKELDFFVPKKKTELYSKTMIFVDSIDKMIILGKYL